MKVEDELFDYAYLIVILAHDRASNCCWSRLSRGWSVRLFPLFSIILLCACANTKRKSQKQNVDYGRHRQRERKDSHRLQKKAPRAQGAWGQVKGEWVLDFDSGNDSMFGCFCSFYFFEAQSWPCWRRFPWPILPCHTHSIDSVSVTVVSLSLTLSYSQSYSQSHYSSKHMTLGDTLSLSVFILRWRWDEIK